MIAVDIRYDFRFILSGFNKYYRIGQVYCPNKKRDKTYKNIDIHLKYILLVEKIEQFDQYCFACCFETQK